MRVGFVVTKQCNATCTHCSQSCGPYRQERLATEDIVRVMNEAAAIDDGSALAFDLTGGEPFLDFEALVEIVSHGTALGAEVSCVTNAFWARSDELARSKLTQLQAAGLAALSASVSRFHQRFVPLQFVGRALRIAQEMGMRTELKGAVLKDDLEPGGRLQEWQASLSADWISIFPILPYLRDAEVLAEEEYYRELGLPFQRCPGDVITVDPKGLARSCCTLGNLGDFLVVGDVHREPLGNIHETFRCSGKQRILRELGPIEFARGAIAAGLGDRLRKAYAGPCDLCLHMQSDPELRSVAEQVSRNQDVALATQG